MSFISELRRRNVFRAAAAYLAVSWVLMQLAEITFPAFGLGDQAILVLIALLAIGLIPALTLAWVFEITPEGVKRELLRRFPILAPLGHGSAEDLHLGRVEEGEAEHRLAGQGVEQTRLTGIRQTGDDQGHAVAHHAADSSTFKHLFQYFILLLS